MQTFNMQTLSMPLVVVTVAEAQANLSELLGLMAAGNRVVISEGENWIAALTPAPPMPLTPEEEAASRARREEAVVEMLKWRVAQGVPLPDGMNFQDLVNKALGRS